MATFLLDDAVRNENVHFHIKPVRVKNKDRPPITPKRLESGNLSLEKGAWARSLGWRKFARAQPGKGADAERIPFLRSTHL